MYAIYNVIIVIFFVIYIRVLNSKLCIAFLHISMLIKKEEARVHCLSFYLYLLVKD